MPGHRRKKRRLAAALIVLAPILSARGLAAQEADSIAPPGSDQAGVADAAPGLSHELTSSYAAEEVSIPTPAGHVLAGTLTRPFGATPPATIGFGEDPLDAELGSTGIPRDPQPAAPLTDPQASAGAAASAARLPAMVLISGSGPDNRDSAPRWMPGYQPFWQIADALTRRGVAVLRLDDRGVGSSTGEFNKATTGDFADDVRAALAYLRQRPDLDGERLGIVGHSEGGVVAVMVAAEDPSLKALVLLATPGTNLRSIVAYQMRYWLERDPTIPFAARERAVVDQLARWDVVADANPRLKSSRVYDPIPAAKRISTPVLILHGSSDRQVPPKHAERLAKALRQGGNADVTTCLVPHVDHLFLQDKSGNPAEYVKLSSRRIPGGVLDELADWTASRLAGGGATLAAGETSPPPGDPRSCAPDAPHTGD
jgi:hypothetical protein